ncbi:MAG TPA: ABC transporter ATP-binding protein, partial [Anaerolineaceae bacterium]|nr:ABC transporter ATP-binding protein [Anaerolineaceae bacterium]
SMTIALSVSNLSKSYNGKLAVDDISFDVRAGEKFIFVGPNGAGKSTTIKIISTLLEKNAGTVRYGDLTVGVDDDAIRKKIGVVFQHHVLDDDFTVRENLICRGGFYDMSASALKKRADEVIELLDMKSFANQRYGKLSGGQRRRADIGRALMQSPEILFLDEPTTGLDPQTRLVVWDIINGIQQDLGTTIFLTTHYMEETDDASNVVIIDHGKIVATGTPAALKKQYAPNLLNLYPRDIEKVSAFLSDRGYQPKLKEDTLQVIIKEAFDALELIEVLRADINNFEVVNGRMDDVFIAITGKALRE